MGVRVLEGQAVIAVQLGKDSSLYDLEELAKHT